MIGVYKITNKKNGRFYIGSSNSIESRWRTHRYLLRNNRHHNLFLQRDYNKCGPTSFNYEVITETTQEKLLSEEGRFFSLFDITSPLCYNVATEPGSPMLGKKHTPEVRQRLSEALSGTKHPHYGKQLDTGWKRNISKSKKRFTDEEEISFFMRHENGESICSIAKSISVHPTTISRAIERVRKYDYLGGK